MPYTEKFAGVALALFSFTVMLCSPVQSVAQAPLTFTDNFEDRSGSFVDNPYLWTVLSPPAVDPIMIDPAAGVANSHGLVLDKVDQSAAVYLEPDPVSVLWVDFDAKLSAVTTLPENFTVSAGSQAVFVLRANGNISAFTGSGWQTFNTNLDTAIYHRYTVKKDYLTRTWNLYVNGSTTAVATNVPFADSSSSAPTFFRLDQGSDEAMAVDNVRISASPPAGFSTVDPINYISWAGSQTWSDGSNTLPSGDSDGDDITNLMEYAMLLDVGVDSQLSVPQLGFLSDGSGEWITISYRRNKLQTDLTYTIQSSTDLSSWTDLTIDDPAAPEADVIETVIDADVDGNGQVEYIQVKVKLSDPTEPFFLRIRVTDV